MKNEYKNEVEKEHGIYFSESKVGEPERGDSAYGPGRWEMAKPTPLDAKSPVMGGEVKMGQGYIPNTNANVDTRNSDTTLNITASEENRSKKFKYPQKGQDTVAEDKVAKSGSSI
jgi:hypothetical protein